MDQPAGVSAVVLAKHSVCIKSADPISARELARWLVEQRLAERGPDGRLHATKLGAAIGGSLRALEAA